MPAHPLCPKEDPKPGAWTMCRRGPGGSRQQATRSPCFRFLIQSVYNVLPGPSHLQAGTHLAHLSANGAGNEGDAGAQCQSLPEGPRRWEVPVVSRPSCLGILACISRSKQHYPAMVTITFFQAGEKPQPHPKS